MTNTKISNNLMTNNHRSAYTLIELMIVISIIGILATLAQPSYQYAITQAKESALQENLFALREVIDQYYADHHYYPLTLSALVDEHYIRDIPKDPFTHSKDSWVLIYYVDEDGNRGIFDVHSGSNRIGTNGVSYNEW